MGDCEHGKCDICGEENFLDRRYYYYNIKCDCCGGDRHFEFIRHCNNCEPKPPRKVSVITEPIKDAKKGEYI